MTETDSEPKDKGDVYRDRNLLALAYIGERMATHDETAGWWPDTDAVNGEEWAVVWVDLPTGQVGWHVPLSLVPGWLPKRSPEYDGYTTAEKNARLATNAVLPWRVGE